MWVAVVFVKDLSTKTKKSWISMESVATENVQKPTTTRSLHAMRDMISTTPLAEYVDMLYTRAAIAFGQRRGATPPDQPVVQDWWMELRPPIEKDDGVGLVRLKAITPKRMVTYSADIHAIQHGAIMRLEELTLATDYHIRKFVEEIDSGG